MVINIVSFKRVNKTSHWEVGVCLGEDKIIIDENYNVVPLPVYDIKDHNADFFVNVFPILAQIKRENKK